MTRMKQEWEIEELEEKLENALKKLAKYPPLMNEWLNRLESRAQTAWLAAEYHRDSMAGMTTSIDANTAADCDAQDARMSNDDCGCAAARARRQSNSSDDVFAHAYAAHRHIMGMVGLEGELAQQYRDAHEILRGTI